MNKYLHMKKKYLFCFLLVLSGSIANAQLNINNAYINISTGTSLVINGDNINRSGGGIISETPTSKLIWVIGNNTSSLTVPFVNNSLEYVPVSFKLRNGASNDGAISFATYAGPNWKNSDYLPPLVTNVNHNNTDNSNKLIDRFWLVESNGYTTAPDITTLDLNYTANEISAAGNAIIEANLKAQVWSNAEQSWANYLPTTTTHGSQHYVTIANISKSRIGWWAVMDGASVLPISLLSFKATNRPSDVLVNWQTTSEINTHHFEVERSSNGNVFSSIGSLAAAGNSSNLQSYSYSDPAPLAGYSFYRLKSVDINGEKQYSNIEPISRSSVETVTAYPNPTKDYVNVQVPASWMLLQPALQLFDAGGKLLSSISISSTTTKIALQNYPSGHYILRLSAGGTIKNISIIKQ